MSRVIGIKSNRKAITRSVIIEKSPFLVLCTFPNNPLGGGEFRVQNSNYSEKFYIIMEGKHNGDLVGKKYCVKI